MLGELSFVLYNSAGQEDEKMDRIIFGAPTANSFLLMFILKATEKYTLFLINFHPSYFNLTESWNCLTFFLLSVLCSQQKHCEISLRVGHVAQRQISCLPCSEAENILSFLFFMKQKFRSSSCIGFSPGEEEREKSSRDKWCNNKKFSQPCLGDGSF